MDDITPNESSPDALPPAFAPSGLPFQRPADYYAATNSRLRPLFPRWVPIGCGWAAMIFVILLFIGGAFAPRSGALLDMVFGRIEEDLEQHFGADVSAAQKAAFAAEMKTMRAAARDGKLKLDRTQSFLKLATDVEGDEKIDRAEADKLIVAARDVNQHPK